MTSKSCVKSRVLVGLVKFELSISHLNGSVEWVVEYAHLGLWSETKHEQILRYVLI